MNALTLEVKINPDSNLIEVCTHAIRLAHLLDVAIEASSQNGKSIKIEPSATPKDVPQLIEQLLEN